MIVRISVRVGRVAPSPILCGRVIIRKKFRLRKPLRKIFYQQSRVFEIRVSVNYAPENHMKE